MKKPRDGCLDLEGQVMNYLFSQLQGKQVRSIIFKTLYNLIKMKKISLILFLFTFSFLQLVAQNIEEQINDLSSIDNNKQTAARNKIRNMLNVASIEAKEKDAPEKLKAYEATLLSSLKSSKNDEQMIFIIRMLGLYGSEKAVATLATFLHKDNVRIHDEARRSLATIKGDEALKVLQTAFKKANDDNKAQYLDALLSFEDFKTVKLISSYLESSNENLQRATILAFSKRKEKAVVTDLWSLYTSTSDKVLKAYLENAFLAIGIESKLLAELISKSDNLSIKVGAFKQLLASSQGVSLGGIMSRASGKIKHQYIATVMYSNNQEQKNGLVNNFNTYTTTEQLTILEIIGDIKASQYETNVLALVNSDEAQIKDKAIAILGKIGTDKSYKILFSNYKNNPQDITSLNALAELNVPQIDTDMIKVLESASTSVQEKQNAMNLLAIRDASTNIKYINNFVSSSQATTEMKKAAFVVMEKGDVESAKILMSYATGTGELVRPAQVSLKKLSTALSNNPQLWTEVYQPVLEGDKSEQAKINIIMILDGLPTNDVVAYLNKTATSSSSESMKKAALSNLKRWTDFKAMKVLISLLKADNVTEAQTTSYCKQIKRLISFKSTDPEKGNLTVEAVKAVSKVEDKLIILSGYEKADSRDKRMLKSYVKKQLEGEDAQITKKIDALI